MSRILVVDDDEDIQILLKFNLEKEGFEVSIANNGEEALKLFESFGPDLVLLDVMMPGMDGIEVCEQIREKSAGKKTIICFLTARNEDYSQISGLEAGADDYVAKPIKPKVLISRIKALLRRNEASVDIPIKENGLTINRDKYYVERGNEKIILPRKEFELLALLASKPNHVFERDFILEKVWGNDIVVGDRTIDVHVRKIREKIGMDYIKTVKGVGYRFEQI
ncbi:MAG: response regulator transcription factor [Bacteroidota bacterium]